MSASTAIQTFSGCPVFANAGINKVSLPLKRNVHFIVRSMSNEGGEKEQLSSSAPSAASPTPTPTPTPMPTPPPKPKVSTNFSDLFAFSGPAPERINGRLAMIGFVAAIGVELANGQDIFSQVQNGGLPLFLGSSVLLTLASLIPLFKGVRAESKSGSIMSSDAELWNGRFAMLGLVALAFTEFVKGGALV